MHERRTTSETGESSFTTTAMPLNAVFSTIQLQWVVDLLIRSHPHSVAISSPIFRFKFLIRKRRDSAPCIWWWIIEFNWRGKMYSWWTIFVAETRDTRVSCWWKHYASAPLISCLFSLFNWRMQWMHTIIDRIRSRINWNFPNSVLMSFVWQHDWFVSCDRMRLQSIISNI